ncbi:hypothetical protein D8M04_03825 [Oceanobacillus piezotolerans]|uniref:Uncharacterized protein n=1 Tax=Oceanobacillus piezotolerans TaxID=2448030 RepID=A0A498DMW7_9BACI|nr:hypothetical protein [Oceanobacillus piezotolerans]RLL48400.1 hypothetical protein D8M04_03825 [Oceanobacillus piezotolerans]
MKRVRKPILQTNILNVAFICIFFAPFMSAMTENLKIIIASVLTIPIVFAFIIYSLAKVWIQRYSPQ